MTNGMRTAFALLAASAVFACAPGAPARVTPMGADASAAEAPDTVSAAAAPATEVASAPTSPADQPQIPVPPNAVRRTNRDTTAQKDSTKATNDTLQPEADFLDSLHTMAADTAHPKALTVPVEAETVHREAAELFGRPAGSAASPPHVR